MPEQNASIPTPERASALRRVHPAIWLCAAWGLLLGVLRVARPGLEIGHGWIDANILNAMAFFDRFGYAPTKGLPTVQTAYALDGEPSIYSTYPAGPYWACEALDRIGIDQLWQLRLVMIVVSMASVYLLCRIVERISQSRSLGLFVGGFYACSVPFVSLSSSFNLVTWGQLTLFLAIFTWLRAEDATTTKTRIRCTILAFLAIALDSFVALEHIPFMGVFIGVRVLMRRRWSIAFSGAGALIAPLPVMGIRLAHNAWALGGFDRALNVWMSKGRQRAGMSSGTDLTDLASVWPTRVGFPPLDTDPLTVRSLVLPPGTFDRTWSYPAIDLLVLVPALAILAVVLASRSDTRKNLARCLLLGSVFLLACAPWFLFMREHANKHLYLIMFIMPGLATIVGGIAWSALAGSQRRHAWIARALGILMIAGFAFDLRRADLFNAFVTLDKRTARAVSRDAEAKIHIARVSDRTPDELTFLVYPRSPETGYGLAHPFIHVNAPPKLPLPEGYALCFEPWTTSDRAYTADVVRMHGQPRVLTPPPSRTMFFRAAHRFRPNASVAIIENLRLTDIRFKETADGASWSLGWVLEGQLSREVASRFVLRAVLTQGRIDKRQFPARLAWTRTFDESLGFTWAVFPKEAFEPGDPVRLEIWDTEEGGLVTLDAERLPPGATLTQGGRAILWHPRASDGP